LNKKGCYGIVIVDGLDKFTINDIFLLASTIKRLIL
jgi:hypothetical protein